MAKAKRRVILTKERWDKISEIMGVWSDVSIARVYGVDSKTVQAQRTKRGIAPYPHEAIMAASARAKDAKTKGLHADILKCLWPTLLSTSGDVHERMVRSHGQVSQRHVIRALQAMVKAGKVKRLEANGTVGYILGDPTK